jgi:ketosteroid isomerase-like protein
MEHPEMDVVRAVYDAFGRADVTAILELFSPDVTVYQSPRVPWGGTHEGHDGLLHFLATLSTTIASTPETERLVADGDGHVVQTGVTRGEVRATGVRFEIPETHVWTVRDARVTCYEVYLDTDAMVAALAPAPAPQA